MGESSQLPPLDFPLPGVTLPPPLPDFVESAKIKMTTLSNGAKIASETSPVCFKLTLHLLVTLCFIFSVEMES